MDVAGVIVSVVERVVVFGDVRIVFVIVGVTPP